MVDNCCDFCFIVKCLSDKNVNCFIDFIRWLNSNVFGTGGWVGKGCTA